MNLTKDSLEKLMDALVANKKRYLVFGKADIEAGKKAGLMAEVDGKLVMGGAEVIEYD